ncbi:DUF948 domain-containing protein [Bacillus carboniphilus]|uniref:DUF948 domain-containing protein n=1 Tax=Bacillus carboniphilus TaxID=86663 RepID=A0ABY9K060_9BACI|nr:DUF948 domain-containing protein [Bacillus carboniphilus]WLR44207.1 DUF948 domain-containing protein [Bacillus carboniphilus]
MIIILYLSVALIAVAFTVLVVYLAKALKSMSNTLNQVSGTLEGMEKQLQGITTETTSLLHKTNALAEDVQQKSERLNVLVDGIKDVGTTVQSFNDSLQRASTSVSNQVHQNKEKVSQVIQWSNVFIDIWDKVKNKKSKSE